MYKGEDQVLDVLSKGKKMTLREIADGTGLNEDAIRRILESLKAGGYVETEVSESHIAFPTKELEHYVKCGFPEASVFRKALSGAQLAALSDEERAIGIRWARVKGFLTIEAGRLVPSKNEAEVTAETERMMAAYQSINATGTCDPVILDEFLKRHLAEKKTVRTLLVHRTGKKFEAAPEFDVS
ncbi:MAG: helix-turn-helix domain-containing protein, partial [Candidatus Aenigmatarchaeota archaeon]